MHQVMHLPLSGWLAGPNSLCLALTVLPDSDIAPSPVETAVQGAAEMVLRRCTRAISPDGSVISMSTALRAELEETTTGMAARGLRTLCITYRDFAAGVQRPVDFFEEAPDTELICCAITGIKVLPTLCKQTHA